ncbi:hypothetical protein MMC24_004961 [Lignoscripta atroalba]|nr:hypothetical protein [Lignoscripta atroalba]
MDLSKPWSNTDQFLWTSYPKPNNTNAAMDPPTLNDGAMWSDGSSLLLFGGALSRARGASPVIPPQGTWKYDILQDAWTNQGFNGARMQRIHLGVTAQSSTNEGYYLGGAITPASDPLFNSIPGAQPYMVSGLVTLQEDDLSFNNLSTVGMNSYNTMTAGYMVLIESLGESGILVAFGGITNSVGSAMGFAPDDLDFPGIQNTLDVISVYDIANETWYQQRATGDVPNWRYFGCSIVVSARDGSSHSMFICPISQSYVFGGWGNSLSGADGSVYVLSVPSFRWIRVTQDTTPRIKSTCHLLGKHTMLVYGGTTPTETSQFDPPASLCDGTSGNFSQGLGIFNLQNHTWTSSYDPADDSAYQVNPQITAVIGGNSEGGANVTWPSAGFNDIRLAALVGAVNDSTSNFASSTTNTTVTTITPSPQRSKTSLQPGSIAAVAIGVLVVLATIISLGLFLLFHRRKALQMSTTPDPVNKDPILHDEQKQELDGSQGFKGVHELLSQIPIYPVPEMRDRTSVQELPGHEVPPRTQKSLPALPHADT